MQIDIVIKTLKKNGFDVYFVETPSEAREIVINEIIPELKPKIISWGDSETLYATKILDEIRNMDDINLIETVNPKYSFDEKITKRREALLSDLFFTGTNALTTKGELVNLDMIGNRVGAITFGPKNVVLFIGINKIVDSIDMAVERIRTYAAPENAIRHTHFKTPCQKNGKCFDCNSPDRICNIWSVITRSFPKGRIKIVLINQSLGL